ncbi:MAG: hypothetical protein L3K03_07520 [Thermoplasmata archaeon]|nr:hypothetical protein [Thermoplasmata archaeon]
MAKRRNREGTDAGVATPVEATRADLSPEDRRELRRRERKKQKAGNEKSSWASTPGRRAVLIGAPVAVIVAVVVLLIVNPFGAPCLNLGSIPASSGPPAFPPHNTTDFSTTWCPDDSPILDLQDVVKVSIGTTSVTFPTAIGRNSSYGGAYACDLPIATQPAVAGYPANVVYLDSPWPYIYTLGDFFTVWAESYSHADVNATYPSQTIGYTTTQILGFTADSTHSVNLFVDGQLSSQGPNLNLDTLPYLAGAYPSCIGSLDGSGHTVLISYTSLASSALAPPVSLGTALHLPGTALVPFNAPGLHFPGTIASTSLQQRFTEQSLTWLLGRPY